MQHIFGEKTNATDRKNLKQGVYGRMVLYLVLSLVLFSLLNNIGIMSLNLQAGALLSVTISLTLGFSEYILRSNRDTMKVSKEIYFLLFIPFYFIITGMKFGPFIIGGSLAFFGLGSVFLTGWFIIGAVYIGKYLYHGK